MIDRQMNLDTLEWTVMIDGVEAARSPVLGWIADQLEAWFAAKNYSGVDFDTITPKMIEAVFKDIPKVRKSHPLNKKSDNS